MLIKNIKIGMKTYYVPNLTDFVISRFRNVQKPTPNEITFFQDTRSQGVSFKKIEDNEIVSEMKYSLTAY